MIGGKLYDFDYRASSPDYYSKAAEGISKPVNFMLAQMINQKLRNALYGEKPVQEIPQQEEQVSALSSLTTPQQEDFWSYTGDFYNPTGDFYNPYSAIYQGLMSGK